MELKQRIRALWRNSNRAERMLWQVLQNPHIYTNLHYNSHGEQPPLVNHISGSRFVRHTCVGEHCVDFLCHQLKVVIAIESDNKSMVNVTMNDTISVAYAYERTMVLQYQGYLVVQLLQQDIIDSFKAVLDNLNILLCQRKLQLLRKQEELTWI